jgi:uncharacterized protein (DUF1697 family)
MRAINVAGHGVVKMEALRDAFTTAGCRNVRTYIQSGNVIFDSPARTEAAVLEALRGKLRSLLGAEPAIFLRTVQEVTQMVARDPFQDFKTEPDVKLYVAFLAEPVGVKPKLPLLLPKEALEVIAMRGRDVFIVSRPTPNGSYGFPNNFIEKELRTSATIRNWNTITKIARLAQEK